MYSLDLAISFFSRSVACCFLKCYNYLMTLTLDVTSLEKALFQLESALVYCNSDLAKQDLQLAMHLRAGAIQAFEFSYELSIKLLRRFLEMTSITSSDISMMSFNELIREGYDKGLLSSELNIWKEYRRERGTTSHAYNGDKADEVFDHIPGFLNDARFLLAQFHSRTPIV